MVFSTCVTFPCRSSTKALSTIILKKKKKKKKKKPIRQVEENF
jgi:hypothetical protein